MPNSALSVDSLNFDPTVVSNHDTAVETAIDLGLPWFVLQTRSRCESVCANILQNKGYEVFLPLYKSRRVWSDRVTNIMLPLFTGYVFCRFNPADRAVPIITTPGVVRIVGVGNTPEPLRHAEIAALQRVTDFGLASEPCPYVEPGSLVRVVHGPLSGIEGTLVKVKKGHRLILSVTLLQRSVSVEVDGLYVTPCTRNYKRRFI